MKKFFVLLVTFLLILSVGLTGVVTVGADSGAESFMYGDFTCQLSDGKIQITDCNSTADEITIPASIDEFPVTSIKTSMFYDNISLKRIFADEDSEYFTSVDGVLFTKDMSTLVLYPLNKDNAEYIVPEGVVVIGESAFKNNTHLKTVILPEGATTLESACFYGCASLESIAIPDSVEVIKGACFSECISLKNFDFPANLKTMSFPEFRNCTSLTDVSLDVQHSQVYLVRILEPTAFFNDESNWEDGALYKDEMLISVKKDTVGEFVVKEGTKAISFGALDGTKVTSVVLPDSVEVISKIALGFNSDLTKVYIPASVTEINAHAFDGHNSDLIIYGEKGSYAESYATEHEICFEASDNQDIVVVLGDANGDGKLNIRDATAIQKHLAKIITLDDNAIELCDFNNDSKVDVRDATAIQKHLAGITI